MSDTNHARTNWGGHISRIIETFQFRKEAPRYFRGVDMEEIKVPKVTRELIAQELIARSGR